MLHVDLNQPALLAAALNFATLIWGQRKKRVCHCHCPHCGVAVRLCAQPEER